MTESMGELYDRVVTEGPATIQAHGDRWIVSVPGHPASGEDASPFDVEPGEGDEDRLSVEVVVCLPSSVAGDGVRRMSMIVRRDIPTGPWMPAALVNTMGEEALSRLLALVRDVAPPTSPGSKFAAGRDQPSP